MPLKEKLKISSVLLIFSLIIYSTVLFLPLYFLLFLFFPVKAELILHPFIGLMPFLAISTLIICFVAGIIFVLALLGLEMRHEIYKLACRGCVSRFVTSLVGSERWNKIYKKVEKDYTKSVRLTFLNIPILSFYGLCIVVPQAIYILSCMFGLFFIFTYVAITVIAKKTYLITCCKMKSWDR